MALVHEQVRLYGAKISWSKLGYGGVDRYPQVSRLASKDVENKINNAIQDEARWIATGALGDNAVVKYNVTKNKESRLVLTVVVTASDSETGFTEISVCNNI